MWDEGVKKQEETGGSSGSGVVDDKSMSSLEVGEMTAWSIYEAWTSRDAV